MADDVFTDLQDRLAVFAAARDWEQFHTPKNLAMALAGEAGELLELFQWLTPEQAAELSSSEDGRADLADELADVAIYLLRLADVTGIDVREAIEAKIDRNERRFPVATVKGRADLAPVTDV